MTSIGSGQRAYSPYLPAEIVDVICRFVDEQRDLKSLRLVNQQCARVGGRALFASPSITLSLAGASRLWSIAGSDYAPDFVRFRLPELDLDEPPGLIDLVGRPEDLVNALLAGLCRLPRLCALDINLRCRVKSQGSRAFSDVAIDSDVLDSRAAVLLEGYAAEVIGKVLGKTGWQDLSRLALLSRSLNEANTFSVFVGQDVLDALFDRLGSLTLTVEDCDGELCDHAFMTVLTQRPRPKLRNLDLASIMMGGFLQPGYLPRFPLFDNLQSLLLDGNCFYMDDFLETISGSVGSLARIRLANLRVAQRPGDLHPLGYSHFFEFCQSLPNLVFLETLSLAYRDESPGARRCMWGHGDMWQALCTQNHRDQHACRDALHHVNQNRSKLGLQPIYHTDEDHAYGWLMALVSLDEYTASGGRVRWSDKKYQGLETYLDSTAPEVFSHAQSRNTLHPRNTRAYERMARVESLEKSYERPWS